MGLKSYRTWKRRREFLEFLGEYGITEDDLRNFKNLRPQPSVQPVNDDDIIAKNEELGKNKKTIEEIVRMYEEQGSEEFYPNGR